MTVRQCTMYKARSETLLPVASGWPAASMTVEVEIEEVDWRESLKAPREGESLKASSTVPKLPLAPSPVKSRSRLKTMGTLAPASVIALRSAGSAEVVIWTMSWTMVGCSSTPKARMNKVIVNAQSVVMKERMLAILECSRAVDCLNHKMGCDWARWMEERE
jgi:hypothetical protein